MCLLCLTNNTDKLVGFGDMLIQMDLTLGISPFLVGKKWNRRRSGLICTYPNSRAFDHFRLRNQITRCIGFCLEGPVESRPGQLKSVYYGRGVVWTPIAAAFVVPSSWRRNPLDKQRNSVNHSESVLHEVSDRQCALEAARFIQHIFF